MAEQVAGLRKKGMTCPRTEIYNWDEYGGGVVYMVCEDNEFSAPTRNATPYTSSFISYSYLNQTPTFTARKKLKCSYGSRTIAGRIVTLDVGQSINFGNTTESRAGLIAAFQETN